MQGRIPLFQVGFVHGIYLAVVWNFDLGFRQDEFANILIESEHVHAVAKRQDQERTGRVQTVGCSDQVGTGLQGICQTLGFLLGAFIAYALGIDDAIIVMFVNSNNRSSRDSSVNVGGTVKGIKDGDVPFALLNDNFLGIRRGTSNQIDLNEQQFIVASRVSKRRTRRNRNEFVFRTRASKCLD